MRAYPEGCRVQGMQGLELPIKYRNDKEWILVQGVGVTGTPLIIQTTQSNASAENLQVNRSTFVFLDYNLGLTAWAFKQPTVE